VAVVKLTNAEVQARWRARQRQCAASYLVDVTPAVLAMLLRHRYLLEDEVNDPREVGASIALFLRDAAEADE
jgi:hypothetical protein